jgi:hypothetical protein
MDEKELEVACLAKPMRNERKLLVIIESPFGSDDPAVVEVNKRYCDACLSDSLKRGEAPFASHRVYTQVLDDNDPRQRKQGMEAGFVWMAKADLIEVYVDRGITEGMMKGIERASCLGKRIEFRKVVGWEET